MNIDTNTLNTVTFNGNNCNEVWYNGVMIFPKYDKAPSIIPSTNEIIYITTNNNIATPTKKSAAQGTWTDIFGAELVSNTLRTIDGKVCGVLTFDGDVTVIGDDAFNTDDTTTNCFRIKEMYVPSTVSSMNWFGLQDCVSLKDIYLFHKGTFTCSPQWKKGEVAYGTLHHPLGYDYSDCFNTNMEKFGWYRFSKFKERNFEID